MVYDPSGVIMGVPGLIQVIAHACRRLKDLQDVVKGAPDLSASLRTLSEILEDVIDEYKKSMNLINPKSRSIESLERCINDCSRTCNKIDDHLSEIQHARRGSRTLKAWWEDSALQGFQSQLEKQKQSLIIHMNRISQECNRKTGSTTSLPMTPPPDRRESGTPRTSSNACSTPRLVQPAALPATAFGPTLVMVDGELVTNPSLQAAINAGQAYSASLHPSPRR